MTVSVTLFTTCKPFEGEFAEIQWNALRSWKRACPNCEVIVFGDEKGVSECCQELGFQQIPEVPRSQFATPLLDGLFEAVERATEAEVLALVNADIMLTGELMPAIQAVQKRFNKFLLIARRWNVAIHNNWDFVSPEWESQLRSYARDHGALEPPYGGVDIFVYPRKMWEGLPPFAIGRTRWDSALIYNARKRGVAVIDATDTVTSIHQNHGYSHYPKSALGVFKGPEAQRNEELLGGEQFIFTALNATHVLKKSGIRRRIDFYPPYLLRKCATMPALYRSLNFLAPAVRYLAPWWRRLQRANRKAKRRQEQLAGTEKKPSTGEETAYPISIGPEPMYPPTVPADGDVRVFNTPEAVKLNRARIDHLRSLNLSLEGRRILDVGCGVGHLAQFFIENGCEILCVDAREENVHHLRLSYPHLAARVFDLEKDSVFELGRFDVVFAYGLLYHLENPFQALRRLAAVCDGLFLLETMVTDHHLPLVQMAEETSSYSEALRNVGSRPTPSFIVLALRAAGFAHIYAPKSPPDHPDFHFTWKDDLSQSRDGHLLRCTFVASRDPLRNPSLVSVFDTKAR